MLRWSVLDVSVAEVRFTDSFNLLLAIDDNNTYVSRMVSIIQTNGDYDKLMQGTRISLVVVVYYSSTCLI